MLNNPSPGVELHIEFMYEIMNKLKEVREMEGKEHLANLKNLVKLFYIGPPGPNGEPLQGPAKVLMNYKTINLIKYLFSGSLPGFC